jgi:hypothetical protein
MIQPGTAAGDEGTRLGQVLTCGCWDCAAYRGHLLRRAALVAVLVGLSCGLAVRAGLWSGELAGRPDGGSEVMLSWI